MTFSAKTFLLACAALLAGTAAFYSQTTSAASADDLALASQQQITRLENRVAALEKRRIRARVIQGSTPSTRPRCAANEVLVGMGFVSHGFFVTTDNAPPEEPRTAALGTATVPERVDAICAKWE